MLTLEQSRGLQEQSEYHVLQQFLCNIYCISYPISFNDYQHVLNNEFQEFFHPSIFTTFTLVALEDNNEITAKSVEINEGKILYIGTKLDTEQKKKL